MRLKEMADELAKVKTIKHETAEAVTRLRETEQALQLAGSETTAMAAEVTPPRHKLQACAALHRLCFFGLRRLNRCWNKKQQFGYRRSAQVWILAGSALMFGAGPGVVQVLRLRREAAERKRHEADAVSALEVLEMRQNKLKVHIKTPRAWILNHGLLSLYLCSTPRRPPLSPATRANVCSLRQQALSVMSVPCYCGWQSEEAARSSELEEREARLREMHSRQEAEMSVLKRQLQRLEREARDVKDPSPTLHPSIIISALICCPAASCCCRGAHFVSPPLLTTRPALHRALHLRLLVLLSSSLPSGLPFIVSDSLLLPFTAPMAHCLPDMAAWFASAEDAGGGGQRR